MKKRNLILTAALFAMTASLAACGGQKPATTQPAAATAAETKGGDQKRIRSWKRQLLRPLKKRGMKKSLKAVS